MYAKKNLAINKKTHTHIHKNRKKSYKVVIININKATELKKKEEKFNITLRKTVCGNIIIVMIITIKKLLISGINIKANIFY